MELDAQFSDYDHENERHVELRVDGLTVAVWRELEFNPDYAPDDEPPEEWADSSEITFDDESAMRAFLAAVGDALIQACFSYFPEGDELQSDEARAAWTKALSRLSDEAREVDAAAVAAVVDFPR